MNYPPNTPFTLLTAKIGDFSLLAYHERYTTDDSDDVSLERNKIQKVETRALSSFQWGANSKWKKIIHLDQKYLFKNT